MKTPLRQNRPFSVVIPQEYKEHLMEEARLKGVHRGIYFDTSGIARVERINPNAEYTYLFRTDKNNHA